MKCFNTVPNSQMVDPKFSEGKPEMLICGNDAKAKQKVVGILKEFGWPGATDIGGIEEAYWLEQLVPLWVRVGAALNTYTHAFKVLRAQESRLVQTLTKSRVQLSTPAATCLNTYKINGSFVG